MGASKRRQVVISGNWKMNHNHYEAIQFVQRLAATLRAAPLPDNTVASLHPPFTSLRSVQTAVEGDSVPVALGAQTCHWEDRGAFTGEVSAEMLAKLNVSYVIAGHSERRAYFGETDTIVRSKLEAILRNQMTPILCVGETTDERDAGSATTKVVGQLQIALGEMPAEVISGIVIAYEPIWAIGTGRVASTADAEEMAGCIRAEVADLGGSLAASGVRIQYGGSVTPENAAVLLACENVDGLLVGGASLDAGGFSEILHAGA